MPDKSRVAENKANIIPLKPLTDVRQRAHHVSAMAKPTKTITFRPSPEDRRIITRLAGKLGIKTSQVIKIALRKYAESEGALRAS